MHERVTGGCGFIGSHTTHHLREKGHRVSVMDNLFRHGSEPNIVVLSHHSVTFFHGDTRNPKHLVNLPARIELICDARTHLRSSPAVPIPIFEITNNRLGVIHILEYAHPHKIPLIFWSSNRGYGADRLNALLRREIPTRFEYDPDA